MRRWIWILLLLMVSPAQAEYFGDTDESGNGSKTGLNGDNKRACKFTLSEDGDVDSIYVWCKTGGGGSPGDNWRGVIYSDNSGAPDALQGTSNEGPVDGSLQWQGIDFPSSVSLTAGTYWLGLIQNTKIDCYFETGSTDQYGHNSDTYSDGPEDPFGTPTYTSQQMAVYVYYTPSGGGGGATPTRRRKVLKMRKGTIDENGYGVDR